MKKIILKSVLLLLPLILIMSVFVAVDPMKVLHKATNPVSSGVLMSDRLFQARWIQDHVGEYNSFIFGSSRSKVFKTASWLPYLDSNAKAFHMGVNDETLYGLCLKLENLDKLGYDIENVFIQLDHRLLSLVHNHESHIFREYYLLSGESAGEYYKRFFTAFLDIDFLFSYVKWQSSGFIGNENQLHLWNPGFKYNFDTGDHDYRRMDSLILHDSINFYQRQKIEVFYDRTQHTSAPLINSTCSKLITRIKAVLDKHQSNYQIVISPNYDQIAMNDADITKLNKVYGNELVANYAGANKWTDDYHNYYEHKHFKPYIANIIFKEVLSQ